MAANSKYWKLRKQQAKDWIKTNLKSDQQMQAWLQDEYKQASNAISAEISREYVAYAKHENIDLSEAMQAVSEEDVAAFAQEAAQLTQARDFSDEANARLKLYNATMRINRLEFLKSKIGIEMTKATANAEQKVSQTVQDAYDAEKHRQSVILGEYAKDFAPERTIKDTLKTYNARGFSKSLWQNQDVIVSKVHQAVTLAMTRGLNPRRIAKDLRPEVVTDTTSAAYAAERIARTETAAAQNQAQLDSFEENDVSKVVWIAEPDACDDCAKRDDKVYTAKRVAAIPVHPNCRCSLAADPGWADIGKELDEYVQKYVERKVGVEIDEFTPCLRDMKTGKLVDTEYHPVSISKAQANRMLAEGWNFDWSKTKGQVIRLSIVGSDTPQGYISFYDDQGFTRVDLVESAPYNIGKDKRFAGVGPHLFAIAAEASFRAGNDGFVSFTPKTLLHNHYRDSLGAQDLPNGDQFIDTRAALVLLKKYMKWG